MVSGLKDSRIEHGCLNLAHYISSSLSVQALGYMNVAFHNLNFHGLMKYLHHAHYLISTYPSPERLPSSDLQMRVAYPFCPRTVDVRQIETNFCENG